MLNDVRCWVIDWIVEPAIKALVEASIHWLLASPPGAINYIPLFFRFRWMIQCSLPPLFVAKARLIIEISQDPQERE